jgi:hypothetical protein
MKTLKLLAFAFVAMLAFTSCNSTTNAPAAPTPEQGAALLRVSVSTAAVLVVRNNPSYVTALQAVGTALDALVIGTTDEVITQEAIDQFVKGIAKRNGVADADLPLFINLTHEFTRTWQDTFKVPVIHRLDPNVTLWIAAVRDGINGALSSINSAHTP